MRILELSLRNFRVFEELDLELPARVIGIFGPNGSGKSSLMEAVLWACYGRARTDKKHIRTSGLLTDCVVRVAFEHGGSQYEVRRTIRGRAHQTDAELLVGDLLLASGVQAVDAALRGLLRMDQQVFRASVFAEQKQLDAFSDVSAGRRKDMVMRLLGIKPVEQALTVARREAKDTRGDAERLAGSLPDTAETERALEEARAEASAAGQRAEAARAALAEAAERATGAQEAFEASDQVRQRMEQLEIERRGARERVEELETHERMLVQRIEGLRGLVEARPTLEAERMDLAGAAGRLDVARRLVEALSEVATVERDLDALPDVDAAGALKELEAAQKEREVVGRALARAEASHDRARDELTAAQDALARAGQADPSQPCPTCGRPLGEDFREYVAHCRKQVTARRKAAQKAATILKAARADGNFAERRSLAASKAGEEARQAADRRSLLEKRLAELRDRVMPMSEEFDGRTPDVDALEEQGGRALEVDRLLAGLEAEARHLAQADRDLAGTAAALGRSRGRLQELDHEEAGLGFDPEEHARIRKERDESGRLLSEGRSEERAASEAHTAAQAAVRELQARLKALREQIARVRQLQDQARVVDRVAMLLDAFRDHLVARIGPELSREAQVLFQELTNHEYDDLRIDEETLAIQIADGSDYFSIARFSGSESDLANLALRVAISLHLSRMSGADVGMLVLDEVLGALDAERKDLFVQTMGRLAGHFHQLFVITHAEQVKDQFPASIEVRKVGRRRSEAVLQ